MCGTFANYAYKVNVSMHNATVQIPLCECVFVLAKKNLLPTRCETALPGMQRSRAAFSLAGNTQRTLYARKVAFMPNIIYTSCIEVGHIFTGALHSSA